MPNWDELPQSMQNEAVRPYYEVLIVKRTSLLIKRIFDIIFSCILLLLLSPIFLIASITIPLESKGPVFFRQTRVTAFGKHFRIFKFRTMQLDAEKNGAQITSINDPRITKFGRIIRKTRLDEIPQLLNIISGDMTFVGTRPEVPKYVNCYSDEMQATLLLPAGITSISSILFKDEDIMLKNVPDISKAYISSVLPIKMQYNLKAIKHFSLYSDMLTIVRTALSVFGVLNEKTRIINESDEEDKNKPVITSAKRSRKWK